MSSPAPATVGRHRAARDILGQLALRGTNLLLGIVVTLLLVRALGDEGFGEWSTIFAVTGIAGYFGTMGLDRVAVERATAEPQHEAEWIGALIALRLLLAIPVASISLAVLLVVADGPEMRVAAVIVSAQYLISPLGAARSVFQLQVRNVVTTTIELAQGVAWAALVIGAVLADSGTLIVLVLGFALTNVAMDVGTLLVARRTRPITLRGTRPFWGQLVQLGVPVGIAGLLVVSYGYIDQVILFQLGGAQEAGYYGAVYRIFERIQFLPATLMTTLFPIIVAARDVDPARVLRVCQMAIDYLLMASLPALTIALAGPESLVRLLFGPEFAPAAPALPVLMGTFVVISIGYLCGYLIIAYKLQRQFVVFALGALVFNVVANYLLVPRYGFMAAAWITLATEVLVNGLAFWAVSKHLGGLPLHARLWRIVAAAALAGLLGFLLRQSGLPTVLWAAGAAAGYGGLLVALGLVDARAIRALRRGESA